MSNCKAQGKKKRAVIINDQPIVLKTIRFIILIKELTLDLATFLEI